MPFQLFDACVFNFWIGIFLFKTQCIVFLPWLQPWFGWAGSDNACVFRMRKGCVATRLYNQLLYRLVLCQFHQKPTKWRTPISWLRISSWYSQFKTEYSSRIMFNKLIQNVLHSFSVLKEDPYTFDPNMTIKRNWNIATLE